jgi:preprotein translocase subunit SecB
MNKKADTNQQMIAINAQYVKDLSFESPNSPGSLVPKSSPPKIDISLNLEAKEIHEDNYEVAIQITTKALVEDQTIFVLELSYAGLFTVKNFTDEQKELVLLIHCPTIIFPFARRIVADVTRDGGFQPLLIDPVDFNQLYRQRKASEQNKQAS